MSTQFNWDFDEEDEMLDVAAERGAWWGKRPLLAIIPLVIIVLIGLGGWLYVRSQVAAEEEARRQEVQVVLDAAHEAYVAGNGSQFFATQSLDPAWQATQLQPLNQQLYQNKPVVTRAEQLEDVVLVNATWQTETEPLQRILFFQWQGGRLVQIPNAPVYWGIRSRVEHDWGDILHYEIDARWQTEIADFVAQTIVEHCPQGCVSNSVPFTLELATDYQPTAVSDEIRVPSPRLVGLTEAGEPSELFWQQLEETLIDRLTPATIRFAIPQTGSLDFQIDLINIHLEAARLFMAQNPAMSVEIVALDSTPDKSLAGRLGLAAEVTVLPVAGTINEMLPAFDGVAISPTQELLSQGWVRDLTAYTDSDPTFDSTDFYEQVWQGIVWRDRVWMVPRQASMQLVYFDPLAYETVGIRPPTSSWTWDEMGVHLRALTTDPPVTLTTSKGFVDATTDTLFAYAYNWNNSCQETATVRCGRDLTNHDVTAALTWYQQLSAQPDYIANISDLDLEARRDRVRGWQRTRRTAATWVDEPGMYEGYALNGPVGVVPFPGSTSFEGVTPLSIQGSIIMQSSKRPFATWQWLKFVSHHASPAQSRYIPARPSVASETDFWLSLPPNLGEAMRTAFPTARPVMIAEQQAITWEQVVAVTEAAVPAETAAQENTTLRWFLGQGSSE